MTVTKLHKLLGQMIEMGHARKPVAVDKMSFVHPLEEDGATILDLESIDIDWIRTIDDDGGTKYREDGSEAGRMMLLLIGADNTRYLRSRTILHGK